MNKKTMLAAAIATALLSGTALANTGSAAQDSILVMFKPGVSK